jgi:hypothetical protein
METKTYDGQTGKFLAKVAENMPKIPASIMQGWIENPKSLQRVLAEALMPLQKFKIWKTIKLGGFRDTDSIRRTFKQVGMKIGIWADNILEYISLTKEIKDINIVIVSVSELGFESGAEYRYVCARAKELGLELCPAEIGPYLFLQYDDQSDEERFIVAMEPIIDSDGVLRLFSVERNTDGSLCLYSQSGHPNKFCYSDYKFVFALP